MAVFTLHDVHELVALADAHDRKVNTLIVQLLCIFVDLNGCLRITVGHVVLARAVQVQSTACEEDSIHFTKNLVEGVIICIVFYVNRERSAS